MAHTIHRVYFDKDGKYGGHLITEDDAQLINHVTPDGLVAHDIGHDAFYKTFAPNIEALEAYHAKHK